MSGVEFVVGGWFASVAIGKFIDTAGGFLRDNYRVNKKTTKMLNNLNNKLTEMKAILEAAEQQQIKNTGLSDWQYRIKDAISNAQDLLDVLKAKRIRENFNSTGKIRKATAFILKSVQQLLFPDNDVSKLMIALNALEQHCDRSQNFLSLLKLELDRQLRDQPRDQPSTNIKNMTPILQHGQPFLGRDIEIKSILSKILGYEIDSLEHESHIDTEFLGIGQNMSRMMRKMSRWLPVGLGAEQVQEPASDINAASSSGVTNIELSSSEDKAQKFLPEMAPTKSSAHYGRPFVIPIFGISGIGKTALAQTIYSHPLLKNHFVLKKWIYMSCESDVNTIVKAFVPIFDPNDPCDREEKFIRVITGKRILLVLDDVSNKVCSMLANIRTLFSSVAYGSAILVTTQELRVANILGTINPVILSPLEWNYFLPLLEYFAFKDANLTNEKREALKSICKKIGHPLPRLPLVAKIMGSLLKSDIDQDKWERISGIHWSSLGAGPEGSLISILEKCYADLNSDLTQCFLFCSIFPPNYIIEKDKIVQMWIANNFIKPDSSEYSKLEESGGMWFDELVDRSFFLPTQWRSKYIMHSAIRELAVAAFFKEGFVFDENPNPCPEGCFLLNEHPNPCFHGYSVVHNGTLTVPDTIRHLTLIKRDLDLLPATCRYDKLHTLLFYGNCSVPSPSSCNYSVPSPSSSNSIFTESRKLRVLELSYRGKGAERHMSSIGKLSLLCFLDLSFTGITELPESLCSLYLLQVLDIRGCMFEWLPKNMNRLIHLRHLYASNQTINLVYGIGKLTLLQELEEFRVSRLEGHTISELAEMNKIGGYMSIKNLRDVKFYGEAVQKASLDKKEHLKALSLNWNRPYDSLRDDDSFSYGRDDDSSRCGRDAFELLNSVGTYDCEVLNSLQPHSALEMLEIVDYHDSLFPSWTWNTLTLVNIKCIHLKGCIRLTNLPPFGMLSCLEILILDGLSIENIDEELYGPNEVIFPKLKVLKFISMKRWKVWSPAGERELCPCLEELEIRDCSNLSNILSFGKLCHLEIRNCSNLTKLPPLGKLRHLETILLDGLPIKKIYEDYYFYEVIFPELKVFKLVAMESLESWNISLPLGREVKSFPCLEELVIQDCKCLYVTPFRSLDLLCLKKIKLSCCGGSLREIICFKSLPKLSSLYISAATQSNINLSYPNFPDLQTLSLEDVNVQFEGNPRNLSNLKRLILNNTKIMWNGEPVLPKLTEIEMQFSANKLSDMARIVETNFKELSPACLHSVKFFTIKRLEYNGGDDQSEWLSNKDYRDCVYILECLFGRLPHLVELTADNIGIPDVSFASLTCLKTLHLRAIKCIHNGTMPLNLKELYIYDASEDLKRRCSPVQGEDWPKIYHIPYIRVNDQTLQMV